MSFPLDLVNIPLNKTVYSNLTKSNIDGGESGGSDTVICHKKATDNSLNQKTNL